jgi:anaerobic selenocysteine-containing dehydrogenase
MPRLPDHLAVIEEADAEYPFRLVAAPARQFLNTSFTETPGSQRREGRPAALVHPSDCTALGLSAGDLVRVGSLRGSIVVHVEPFDGLQQGVVIIESIWPNGAFIEGVGVNALTGADAGPPGGGAAFHDTAVWLRAA